MISSEKDRPSAVVTGASSGIGEAIALRLDRLGFRVFAGVRNAQDGEALQEKASPNLCPIFIDITDAGLIAAARDIVAQRVGPAGLNGLVNNAGIAVHGAVEFVPLEYLRRQLEVNVVGTVAVIQAFIPLLRLARQRGTAGRIVNITSICGVVATPGSDPYSASKFALEGLTDCLRLELGAWGIDVSAIEPGYIETPIWRKSAEAFRRQISGLPPSFMEFYGPRMEAIQKVIDRTKFSPPEVVASAVAHALTARRPRTRYLVGTFAGTAGLLARLPDRLRDRILLNSIER